MCEKKFKRGIKISAKIVSISFIGMGIIAKLRKGNSVYDNEPEQKNPLVGKKVVFVNDENDRENADGVKGHLEAIGENKYNPKFYDKYIKRILDIILSGLGLIILLPIYVMIALAIKFEDAGPVFFTQKRIGQNKQYFKLHKFRTMKISTPHDIPTYMLTNPELYITKIGKFLRVHSLDGRVIIGQTTESLENKGVCELVQYISTGVMTYFLLSQIMRISRAFYAKVLENKGFQAFSGA